MVDNTRDGGLGPREPTGGDATPGSGLGEQALARAVRASQDGDAVGADDSLVAKGAAQGLEFEDVPDPGGPVLNLVSAGFLGAIGVFFLVAGWNLTLGTFDNPGPRLWPLILTILCLVVAAVLALLARTGTGTERFTRGVRYVLLGAVALLAYSVIESVGFELPTLIVAIVWLKFIGREGWVSSIASGIGAVVAIYLIFIIGLRVSLPHLIPV